MSVAKVLATTEPSQSPAIDLEIQMKKLVLFPIVVALAVSACMSATIVEAKSVKWSCVALDPNTPWIQTCYPSTNRP